MYSFQVFSVKIPYHFFSTQGFCGNEGWEVYIFNFFDDRFSDINLIPSAKIHAWICCEFGNSE